MAKDAVKTIIHGIKCDNPDCNFKDMAVKFEDYEEYVNKPCPLCGENLLTQQDYDKCRLVMSITNLANKIFKMPDDYDGSEDVIAHMDFEGGKMISKVAPAQTFDQTKNPEINQHFNKKNAEWIELELIKARKAEKTKKLEDIDPDVLKILVYSYNFTDDHLAYIFNTTKVQAKRIRSEKGVNGSSAGHMLFNMKNTDLHNVDKVYESCIM